MIAAADRKSYGTICVLYILHGLSFCLLIPALPLLTLRINGGDAAKSSLLYGMASFVRYMLEFFSAPVLGSLADVKGRRIVLFGSFVISAMEFLLLAAFPSITMVFITRTMSGLGDASVATSYAIVTDIAMHNRDVVSQQYSMLGAMTGIAFIVGPYVGGLLCEIDITVCFFVSAIIAILGAMGCWFVLEETVAIRCEHADDSLTGAGALAPSINPIVGMRVHLSNPKLRRYVLPLFLCTMNSGMSFLWYLYMAARFQSSPAHIGIFLSFHGLLNALILGLLVQQIVPAYVSERDATMVCVLLSAAHMVLNGMCCEEYQLYIVAVAFGLSVAYLPAFKSVIVNDSLENKSGPAFLANLQGFISSVRTIATAIGALVYSAIFSIGMSTHPSVPQAGFYVAGAVFLVAWFYLRIIFITTGDSPVSTQSDEELLGLVDGHPHHHRHKQHNYDSLHPLQEQAVHDETEYLS